MKSYPQEGLARSLAQRLGGFTTVRVEGNGVHWHVNAGSAGERTVRIDCFHYDAGVSALMMGINPANARSGQQNVPSSAPRSGAEYFTQLFEGEESVADGRTSELARVEVAVQAWLEGRTLTEIEAIAPYVDERGRLMRSIAESIDPALRVDLGQDPTYDLWVYGDGRSCRVRNGQTKPVCTFWIGGAQVAMGEEKIDIASAVHAWLLEDTSIGALPERAAGVVLGRHAAVLELDPAKWHWLHVQERIGESDDVLTPLGPLLERLAESPVATRFYSYSSLNRFCFSASSHYPWVHENLPVVAPASGGRVFVDDVAYGVDEAVSAIEKRLEDVEVSPFFGSAADHDFRLLETALERTGSVWRPELRQSAQWYEVIGHGSGGRVCKVQGLDVKFVDGETATRAQFRTVDDLADALLKFCEHHIPLAEVISDGEAG